MEVWKQVKGYEGIYEVSNCGNVKRVGKYKNQTSEWKSEKKLKPAKKKNGYLFCQLSKNNNVKPKHIHRLVAEAFIPNPENKPTVNHKDGNKSNNNVENLEWATYQENNIHSIKQLHRNSKNNRLSKTVIQFDLQGNIIAEYPSYREAQRQTGITTIYTVCNGKQKTAGGYIWKYKEDIEV